MDLIVIVVILFGLVEGAYRRWVNELEKESAQSMIPEFVSAPREQQEHVRQIPAPSSDQPEDTSFDICSARG